MLLVADADVSGRKAMEALAKHLHSLGCKVRIYLPEGDDGNDIADWIEADDAGTAREQIEAGVKEWTPMDWMDELVERAKTDAGAPFETDMMAKLAELQRDKIAEWQRLCPRLKDAGVTIGKLERAIARSDRKDGDGLQGQPLHWDEVEPCPDPVDGAALLDELVELIRKHASLPDGGAEAVALWALYAWCFRAFGVCPNLMITAPERESGKTCVTELLTWMVPRPQPVSDASGPAIVRTIEHACPTLLFDEAQHFLRRRPEDPIRGILLASFVKRFASVNRCEGEMNKVRVFSTFTPKAMNGRNLANLDDMLTSRSVVIPMTRATKRYPHIRPDRDPVGCGITGKCARWRDDHSSTLADADPDMGHLWGRIADVWRPLFAIADVAGGEWPARARQAATNLPALTATVADGETLGVQLLEDIYQVFKDKSNPDEISTADLDRGLNEMSERPWPTLNNGKPMTEAWKVAVSVRYPNGDTALQRTPSQGLSSSRVSKRGMPTFRRRLSLNRCTVATLTHQRIPAMPNRQVDAARTPTHQRLQRCNGSETGGGGREPSRRRGTRGDAPFPTKPLAVPDTDPPTDFRVAEKAASVQEAILCEGVDVVQADSCAVLSRLSGK